MASRSPKIVEIAPALPSNIEAERTILGAVMLENKYLDEVSILKDLDFSSEQNRVIFKTMNEMAESGETIDLVTLHSKLDGKGLLAEAGGVAYVSKLSDGLPRITNVIHYANILRRKSMSRQIIQISNLAQQLAFESSDVPEEIGDQTLKQLMDLTVEYASKKLLGKTSSESRVSLLQSLEKKENLLRVNTGLGELDKAVGGFRSGELVTITASVTGSGKTLFAQQIRKTACSDGNHGIYFSGEMLAEQLASRELATEAGVPHWKMRRPEHLTPEEYTALCSAANDCNKCRIVDGEFSIRDIRIACRRMKRNGELSWVVIDYDELVDAPGKDEFAQQRNVIRESKRLAMTLEVPVFVISGIRKPVEKGEAKRPRLETIYGSGSKSKHSTYVLYIDREYVRELKGEETKAAIYILKSRNGKIGKIEARFNTATLRFENVKEEPEQRDDF